MFSDALKLMERVYYSQTSHSDEDNKQWCVDSLIIVMNDFSNGEFNDGTNYEFRWVSSSGEDANENLNPLFR